MAFVSISREKRITEIAISSDQQTNMAATKTNTSKTASAFNVSPSGRRKTSNFTLFPSPDTPPSNPPKHQARCKSLISKSGSKSFLPLGSGAGSRDDDQQPKQSSTTLMPFQVKKGKDTIHSVFVTNLLSEDTQNVTPKQDFRPVSYHITSKKKQHKIRAFFRRHGCLNTEQETPISPARPSGARFHQPKASGRLSRILDLERGEVNRRKLSTYLGSVLDPDFEVPGLQDIASPCCWYQNPLALSSATMSQTGGPNKYVRPQGGDRCKCYLGTTICQCSSSTEFKEFCKEKPDHNTKTSISSNQCMLSVPRARFKTVFLDNEIPVSMEIPTMSSPPGLSYSPGSSEYSGSTKWSNRARTSEETIPSSTSNPQPKLLQTHSSLDSQLRGEDSQYTKHSRVYSSSRTFRQDLSPMPERGELSPVTECSEYSHSVVSTPNISSSSTSQPGKHHKFSYGVELAKAFNIQIESKSTNSVQDFGTRPDTSGKASIGPKYQQSTISRKSSRPRYGHVYQTSNSSAGSSIGEILEADNTATVALAQSAKFVTITPKANTSAQITNWPPEPRSKAWLRIQYEQDRKLAEIREKQRQLCQRRPLVPIRSPVSSVPGNLLSRPVIGKRTSSLQTRNKSSIDTASSSIQQHSTTELSPFPEWSESRSDWNSKNNMRIITNDTIPTGRNTRYIVVS